MTVSTTTARKVFVVDDDPSVRRSLERLFRHSGWAVQTFASAEAFLEHDLDGAEGCVIVDIHLGRMRGLELRAALGRRADPMQFIFITGVDNADTEAAGRAQGAAFFHKPFDVVALMDVVERCLMTSDERRAKSDERRATSEVQREERAAISQPC
jgi:FixJ family two-component response regulator